jgi:hypothetical protein
MSPTTAYLSSGFAKLLVEKIVVGRDEEGQPKVDVTYRFGPPGHDEE